MNEIKVQSIQTLLNIKKLKIPSYQRPYKWKKKNIEELLTDIDDALEKQKELKNSNFKYRIGTVLLHNNYDNKTLDVIDGQQRLTTLFLLLSYLGVEMKQNFFFDCRKKSNLTLQYMIENDFNKKLNESDSEKALFLGKEIINSKFISDKISKEDFKEKLSKVILYRIEVPDGTDLNRYFEIMNTRGEQLEQHDVLKAKFMELIDGAEIRNKFAEIWEACSDMTGYVQMNMSTELRKKIFGKRNWNNYPKFEDYVKSLDIQKANQQNINADDFDKKLNKILNSKPEDFEPDTFLKECEKVRFEAPINFTYFLLHVLRVYNISNNLQIKLSRFIEDIKLLEEYKLLFELKKKDKNLSVNFLDCLLKCRYLMDYYIIKREYNEENKDGEWRLKCFNKSKEEIAYYTEAFESKHNLMLQAAMRVSFTSPKIMHWITDLLFWLYKRGENWTSNKEFQEKLKSIIVQSVTENFFKQDNYERMGVETPHIAFNYLDYLLWEENSKRYKDFNFEYRTSVEHWFPQHHSEGTFTKWEQKEVDNFGNLCIIQRNVNSKFSNLEPHSKKATFEEMINKGSLKLRIMAEKTTEGVDWKNIYKSFGEEMLDILAKACNFDRNK